MNRGLRNVLNLYHFKKILNRNNNFGYFPNPMFSECPYNEE